MFIFVLILLSFLISFNRDMKPVWNGWTQINIYIKSSNHTRISLKKCKTV